MIICRYLSIVTIAIAIFFRTGYSEKVSLYNPGKEDIVDYDKYGTFSGLGTSDYRYVIKNRKGLARACGEGIYPDTRFI